MKNIKITDLMDDAAVFAIVAPHLSNVGFDAYTITTGGWKKLC